MKKLNLIITGVAAVGMIQACGGSTPYDSTADSAAIKKTDTTIKMMAPVTDTADIRFTRIAALANMGEITVSRLAHDRSVYGKIKEYAAMMIVEHTQTNKTLMALAKAKSITLPADPDTTLQNTINYLSKKIDADFDRAYINQMINDHVKTIALFENEQKNTNDAELRAFAIKTLPVLNIHLQAIRDIKDDTQ